MKFPLNKYIELPSKRKNTLQIFITNRCNLSCKGCFARNIMKTSNLDITIAEYTEVVKKFIDKGGQHINIIGGEPLLHPRLKRIIEITHCFDLSSHLYTNGLFLDRYKAMDFLTTKIRTSVYCKNKYNKAANKLPLTNIPIDVCYMVGKETTTNDLLGTAKFVENNYNCNVFFISSIRELDNKRHEFFDDTNITMNLIRYKELVCGFLNKYNGKMQIHISKRGMFESTKTMAENKCRFANYFIGGKIIQCPYDVVNCKFQKDYTFNKRHCQHNNTCLMSKIIYVRKIK